MTFQLYRWLVLFLCLTFVRPTVAQEPAVGNQETHSTNALANESSPYLLMHAHNPVNWRPWNEAALALAKEQDKPIFLSIGYSSCHWCHVMERESFLDQEIADFLNKHFICIKVDREERPDVDEIYMHALLAIQGGGGGWPMSMFLTPEAKPFFGGTYWPARDGDRGARMGFLTIIQRIEEFYSEKRELIEQDANKITEMTRELLSSRAPDPDQKIDRQWIRQTASRLSERFDTTWGGFGFRADNPRLPKFPEPSNLLFLIDQLQHPGEANDKSIDEEKLQQMLVTTCEKMMLGGIQDHLGGGFHRYSVDRFWRIPHFEKMLYDNGQLASVYVETYALTGRDDFRRTAEGILDFVQQELLSPEGGFYSSLDAESEGEEGKYYRWTRAEIEQTLNGKPGELFMKVYGIDQEPNFEQEYYAPQLSQTLTEHANQLNLPLDQLNDQLQQARESLKNVRLQRVKPALDNKILTAWNGLMIRGYADAGRILDRNDYLETASRAAQFALDNLFDDQNRLQRTYTGTEAKLKAYLVDYACLIDGLLALHRASDEKKWLAAAEKLQQQQDRLFWDPQHGGYFYTGSDHEVLIARSKQLSDGAMPSGNSVAAGNLLYLAKTTGNQDYQDRARRTVLAAASRLDQSSLGLPRMLIAVRQLLQAPPAQE